MAAEDYHDVPGIGGSGSAPLPKSYDCQFCGSSIKFSNRKAFNFDGTLHRCKRKGEERSAPSPAGQEATLYALAAMNAIINGQIQSGGVDFIHHMNFQDVADAAWRVAIAMKRAEKDFRHELEQS